MPPKPTPDEHEAIAITTLVDDPSAGAETSDAAAWGDRPDIRRQVESQRRVSRELRAGGPAAPDRLVRTVQDKVRERYGADAEAPRRRGLASRLSWRPAVAVTAVAARGAAAVIGIVGIGGGGSGPSIPAAAGLAFAPSTGPAPGARNAKLLDVSYGGVTYPNYAKFSVPPTGTRTDRIGGRPALTVFYRLPNGTPLSYTVFSGKPVSLPRAAIRVVFDGVALRVFSAPSSLAVVTLVRFGHTCVLAAPTDRDLVLSLAAAPIRA